MNYLSFLKIKCKGPCNKKPMKLNMRKHEGSFSADHLMCLVYDSFSSDEQIFTNSDIRVTLNIFFCAFANQQNKNKNHKFREFFRTIGFYL